MGETIKQRDYMFDTFRGLLKCPLLKRVYRFMYQCKHIHDSSEEPKEDFP